VKRRAASAAVAEFGAAEPIRTPDAEPGDFNTERR